VERRGEDLVIFNQTYESTPGTCSYASVLAIDEGTGLFESTWEYQNAECSKVNYLGSAHPMPNGNLLVDFSQAGIMDEVAADGTLVKRYKLELGYMFAYAQQVENLTQVTE
jgi:hypothetical protein